MTEFELYLDCMDNDVDLQYGRLTLCNLKHYIPGYNKKRTYQVHCDDAKIKFSGLYEHIEHAIRKFIELKREVKPLWRGPHFKKKY